MLQSLRSSTARRAAAAMARTSQTTVTRTTMRTFIVPTAARRADFVQELYLKELKAYKIPAVKPEDAADQVATFVLPTTPASPEEADLASSLQEYESMAVEVEGQETPADGAEAAAPVEDWLVEEDEEEGAHH